MSLEQKFRQPEDPDQRAANEKFEAAVERLHDWEAGKIAGNWKTHLQLILELRNAIDEAEKTGITIHGYQKIVREKAGDVLQRLLNDAWSDLKTEAVQRATPEEVADPVLGGYYSIRRADLDSVQEALELAERIGLDVAETRAKFQPLFEKAKQFPKAE